MTNHPEQNTLSPFSLVVNAGGQSRRMGQPKALLPIPPNNQSLLSHIINRLQPLCQPPVVIVANDATLLVQAGAPANATVVGDRYPDTGTLGGIATGLSHCPNWALMVACDMPLLNPALFRWFQQIALETEGQPASERWDAIMPVVANYEEPLHALYHRRCLPAIERRLAAGERRVISFFSAVRVRYVQEEELRRIDPQLHSFFNANTPEEWQVALTLLRQNSGV